MATGKKRYNAGRRATPGGKTRTWRDPLLRALAAIGLFPARRAPARRPAPATRGTNRRRATGDPERRYLAPA